MASSVKTPGPRVSSKPFLVKILQMISGNVGKIHLLASFLHCMCLVGILDSAAYKLIDIVL